MTLQYFQPQIAHFLSYLTFASGAIGFSRFWYDIFESSLTMSCNHRDEGESKAEWPQKSLGKRVHVSAPGGSDSFV